MIAGCGTLLPSRSMPSSIRWTPPRFAGSVAVASLIRGSYLRIGSEWRLIGPRRLEPPRAPLK